MVHLKFLEKQEQTKAKLAEGKKLKHKGWNQWNRDKKDQWNKKQFLWKDT
jgi:hypothetical protein